MLIRPPPASNAPDGADVGFSLPFACGSMPAISLAGDQVAFASYARLLPQDGDNARDVYVARVDGGSLTPTPPTPCEGEACQGAAVSPPAPPASPASAALKVGNPTRRVRCRKGFVKRRGRCLKRCRKGFVKRRGRCIKRSRLRKQRAKQRARRNHRQASSLQGGRR